MKALKASLLLFLLLAFLPSAGTAYDFTPSRTRLSNDVRSFSSSGTVKIAVIFQEESEDLKYSTNLVKLKSQFTSELSREFKVADPVIVGEIVSKNQLSPDEIVGDKEIFTQFQNRAEATHVLLVTLSADGGTLIVSHKLMADGGRLIDNFPLRYPLEPIDSALPATAATGGAIVGAGMTGAGQTEGLPSETGQPNSAFTAPRSISQSGYGQQNKGFDFQNGYSGGSSSPGAGYTYQNQGNSSFSLGGILPLGTYNHMTYDSWTHFQPTAIVNPKTHYLELSVWGKDWEGVDLPMQKARYSLTYQRIEVAVFGYTSEIKEYKGKASYGHIKFNPIDALSFQYPFFLSLGIKKNLFWDEDNPDLYYGDDENVLERNEKLNNVSLFGAINLGVEALGLMGSLYYDNVYFSGGVNLMLHSIVRVFFDFQQMHIRTDYKKSDSAYGLEINDPRSQNFAVSLARQENLSRTMLTLKFAL